MSDLPTGTVTFLFTDIEGSTKLWEENPEAMRSALQRHDALLRQAVRLHGGHVFKTLGDAFCTVFATAPDALAAALDAQCILFAENWPEECPIRVRIALHTGTAEPQDGDYFGPSLNRVARLLAVGHGGQTLLSLATQELTRDTLPRGTMLRSCGEHRLRDLSRPETIFQLLHPALPDDFPPLRSLDNPDIPNNLPQQLTSFIGRETGLAEAKAMLDRGRLLTLTGAGGCGKTRLALQAAADMLDTFTEGVFLVELAPLSDPVLVPQTIARTLGVREEAGVSAVEALTAHLRSKRLLLVLDNCEHVLNACAQLVTHLLRFCPQVRVLATSREALGITRELTYRVPSLSLPIPGQQVAPERLPQYEAARLFIDRALLHAPNFTVTHQNAPALVQLCHRLDGIPLALELAAARVRALSVEQIAARLDDRFRLLTGGSRAALPRHQTLRALIDWSYELLTETERLLLRRLAIFQGGWTLEAAEKICAGEGIDEFEVLELLLRLVDKSLVVFEETEGAGRYRMLETVRQYLRERLLMSGERPTLILRHRDYFLAFAEEALLHCPGPEEAFWLDRVESEHDNLRAVLDRCRTDAEGALPMLRLTGALHAFWYVRSYLREGRHWYAEALERPEAKTFLAERARALRGAGALARNQGDIADAHALYAEALAISRELNDRPNIADVMSSLGHIHHERSEWEEARACYEESLALSRELDDPRGTAYGVYCLSFYHSARGDYATAQALIEESLAIYRTLAHPRSIANCLSSLGNTARIQGKLEMAQAYLEESLVLRRQIGNPIGIAEVLLNLALIAEQRGDLKTEGRLLTESLTIFRERGDRWGTGEALYHQAKQARQQGDLATAQALGQESLRLRREVGYRSGMCNSLEELVWLAEARGDAERAARLAGAVATLRETLGTQLTEAEHAETDGYLERIRAALGPEQFSVLLAEGHALSLDAALAYALEEQNQLENYST